jgi:hypothetical protein
LNIKKKDWLSEIIETGVQLTENSDYEKWKGVLIKSFSGIMGRRRGDVKDFLT